MRYMIRMNITKTVLKCNNCHPNNELSILNPRWCGTEEMKKFMSLGGVHYDKETDSTITWIGQN